MPLIARLAGYNLDSDLIQDILAILQKIQSDCTHLQSSTLSQVDLRENLLSMAEFIRNNLDPESLTPETISAAYARISRDPSHVTELRKIARQGIARARKSNENIVFGLGHASVAEHASFNFDVSGISRLASEELQSHRLLSFTEKSQRYITISTDYVIPPELIGTTWETRFQSELATLFEGYNKLCEALIEKYLSEATHELSKIEIRDLETKAKEDARYLLPLACTTQMGMTLNARDLEHVCRDMSDHPLAEVRLLGKTMTEEGKAIAPSLVKYTSRGTYPRSNRERLLTLLSPQQSFEEFILSNGPRVKIVESTPNGESSILKALCFTCGERDWQTLEKKLIGDQTQKLWQELYRGMGPHDTAMRELEMASITFEADVSASCFAQLKRHRMMTLLQQNYRPTDGAVIPPSITAAGFEKLFIEAVNRSTQIASELHRQYPLLSPYLVTNAHTKRVLMRVNVRELYHISRLRSDAHAQWEIRILADKMLAEAQSLWPNVLRLACGKDRFEEIYNTLYSA